MADNNMQIRRGNNNNQATTTSNDGFQQMDQMIERFFRDPFSAIFEDMPVVQQRRHFGDVRETDTGYILTAEVPGVPMKDIDISVNGNTLTIKAEQNEEQDNEQGYRRQYRSFNQSFTLPNTIDAEKIEAHCENGLLEVLLPKAQIARAKRVEVQTGKGGLWNRLMGKNKESDAPETKSEAKKH
jgi:HSP20 family protein